MKTTLVGAMRKFHVVYMFWQEAEDGKIGSGWGADELLAPVQPSTLEPLAEELKKEYGFENVLIFNIIPLEVVGGSQIITGVG